MHSYLRILYKRTILQKSGIYLRIEFDMFRIHGTCNCFMTVSTEDFIFYIYRVQRELEEPVEISSMCFGTMVLDFVCLND